VDKLSNNDIITCSSDKITRVFSCDPNRWVSKEQLEVYEKSVLILVPEMEKALAINRVKESISLNRTEYGLINELLKVIEPSDINKYKFCSKTVKPFYQSQDKSWGCGFKNIQTLYSTLYDYYEFKTLSEKEVPSVNAIQAQIEEGWKKGIDLEGAEFYKNTLVGSDSWIGSTEVATFFANLNIKTQVLDFNHPTEKDGTHPLLIEQVIKYFGKPDENNERICELESDSLPPIYLQYVGHSLLVLGYGIESSGKPFLFVHNPLAKAVTLETGEQDIVFKYYQEDLIEEQYQVVWIIGPFKDAEDFEKSKVIKSLVIV